MSIDDINDDLNSEKSKIESISRKLADIQKEKKEMEQVLKDIEKEFANNQSSSI